MVPRLDFEGPRLVTDQVSELAAVDECDARMPICSGARRT
jgi:hypothetical protein